MATSINKGFTIIDDVNLIKPGQFRYGDVILCNENHGIYFQLPNKIDRYGGLDVRDNLESTETKNPLSANMGKTLNEKINLLTSKWFNSINLVDINVHKLEYEIINTQDKLYEVDTILKNIPSTLQYHDIQLYDINKAVDRIENKLINIATLSDIQYKANKGDIKEMQEDLDSFKENITNSTEKINQSLVDNVNLINTELSNITNNLKEDARILVNNAISLHDLNISYINTKVKELTSNFNSTTELNDIKLISLNKNLNETNKEIEKINETIKNLIETIQKFDMQIAYLHTTLKQLTMEFTNSITLHDSNIASITNENLNNIIEE